MVPLVFFVPLVVLSLSLKLFGVRPISITFQELHSLTKWTGSALTFFPLWERSESDLEKRLRPFKCLLVLKRILRELLIFLPLKNLLGIHLIKVKNTPRQT